VLKVAKYTKETQQEALTQLKEIIKRGTQKDSNGKVKITYTIRRVAPSGMSRVFDAYIETKDGLININRLISIINEETITNDFHVRVYGCGTDMLFDTSYRLNGNAIYLDNYRGKKKNCYNYIVSTYYNYI
jgi:hypothetical protein